MAIKPGVYNALSFPFGQGFIRTCKPFFADWMLNRIMASGWCGCQSSYKYVEGLYANLGG
ncbi:MAG: hypothetical protein CTY16_06780 [Methylobacter sp.]|nr:MAG: hypothetical protein CTY16_06780 [Methylobacter sp.]